MRTEPYNIKAFVLRLRPCASLFSKTFDKYLSDIRKHSNVRYVQSTKNIPKMVCMIFIELLPFVTFVNFSKCYDRRYAYVSNKPTITTPTTNIVDNTHYIVQLIDRCGYSDILYTNV